MVFKFSQLRLFLAREGGSMVAKFSPLLWAVLVFVAKPALADNFTYKQYSASSEGWKNTSSVAGARHRRCARRDLRDFAAGAGLADRRDAERFLDPREPVEHLLVDAVGLLVEVRDLELGLDVDLVFDVGPHAVFRGLAGLADQHEARQEDRLERHNHRQRPNGNGSNGSNHGIGTTFIAVHATNHTPLRMRNAMLPENAAITSALRSSSDSLLSVASLTLRDNRAWSSAFALRVIRPIAPSMSRPASGRFLNRCSMSSRSRT